MGSVMAVPDSDTRTVLAYRDVVFVNEDEAAAISGLAVPGAAEAVPAGRWFNERGAALTVVTLGCVWRLALLPPGRAAVCSAVLVLDCFWLACRMPCLSSFS